MKKTILLVPFLAVGVAFAVDDNSGTVEGQNAIGILEVTASSKPTTVLLSVPFAGYGVGQDLKASKLKASELVAKETLPEGTKLRVAAEAVGDYYYTWNLTSEKTWEPVDAVTIGKDGIGTAKTETPSADTIFVGRGNSFWLVLPSSPALGSGAKITLVGQQDASATSSIDLSGGKWNLVGNPGVADFCVAQKIESLAEGDQISVQSGITGMLKTYRYNGTQWTCGRQTVEKVEDIKLAPGDGCWIYVQNAAKLNF